MTTTDILTLTALLVTVLIALSVVINAAGSLFRRPGESGSSPDKPLALLDYGWRIEGIVYRHHRIAGGLIVLASGVFLWQAASYLDSLPTGESIWSMAWWLLVASHGFTALVGIIILLRPSRLKSLETLANRRYELDGDSPVSSTVNPLALILLVTACIVLAGLVMLLLERLSMAG
jgi:hypothetical protein